MDQEKRLYRLTELQDGWLGPGSLAPDPRALAFVGDVLAVEARLPPDVHVTANGSGAVVLEWRAGVVECTLEIDSAKGEMYFVADNTEDDSVRDEVFPMEHGAISRVMESGAQI